MGSKGDWLAVTTGEYWEGCGWFDVVLLLKV